MTVAVLIAGYAAKEEFGNFKTWTAGVSILNDGKAKNEKRAIDGIADLEKMMAGAKQYQESQFRARIAFLDQEIQRLNLARAKITSTDIFRGSSVESIIVDKAKLDIEIELLQQERNYLSNLLEALSGPQDLARVRQAHVRTYRNLENNEQEQAQLKLSHPVAIYNPLSNAYGALKNLEAAHANLLVANLSAYDAYLRKRAHLKQLEIATKEFHVRQDSFSAILTPTNDRLGELKSDLLNNWVSKVLRPITEVLPTALGILASIVLVSIGIKAFFYYVLAPAASRRPPVILLPESSGLLDTSRGNLSVDDKNQISAKQLSITIDANQELLIHPQYLQIARERGGKNMKWLMNNSYPWSSLLSGMFGLTRIQTAHGETITLGAPAEPFSEFGVIALPEGSAIALQPSGLIGVAYPQDQPVKISRHWRINSLQAWLTLQLRYLVFHGPAKLIVKGCNGVRIESASSGLELNQALTMGFSANLNYSTGPSEVFFAYLTGQKELLNDRFSGGPGFFVYKVTPYNGKKGGVTGRGLEGLTDTLLKVFGI